MAVNFHVEIIPASLLSAHDYQAVVDLCSRAFDEDYEPYLHTFLDATHLLGKVDGVLVSHALWITRWLQIGDAPLLKTAYVEGVATDENHRGRGYATVLMEHLVHEIQDYDIGGLCPADTNLYARLGWEFWQGLLFHRKDEQLILDPEEELMILRLPKTLEIDTHQPISIEWRAGEVW